LGRNECTVHNKQDSEDNMKPSLPTIKKIIKKAHPKVVGLKVAWVKKPFWLHEPHFEGWWSLVKIEADGYRSKVMPATINDRGNGRLQL